MPSYLEVKYFDETLSYYLQNLMLSIQPVTDHIGAVLPSTKSPRRPTNL